MLCLLKCQELDSSILLHFFDLIILKPNKATEKLAPIRDVLDMFGSSCKKWLHPSDHLRVVNNLFSTEVKHRSEST